MKNKFISIFLFLFTDAFSQQYWPSEYIFYDEFNGTSIDEVQWKLGPDFIGGQGFSDLDFDNVCNFPDFDCLLGNLGCYSNENVIVQGGNCELKSTYDSNGFLCNNGDLKFAKSGMIVSNRRFKYGTFEARIKMEVGMGLWPAFWLYGCDDPGYNTCGEIDIFEINAGVIDKLTNNWHRVINNQNLDNLIGYDFDGDFTLGCFGNQNWENLHMPGATIEEWHDYKMVWAPGSILYYIDNNLIRTEYQDLPEAMHLILNVAIEGAEDNIGNCSSEYLARGGPNQGSFPNTMSIDYVKVTPLLVCENINFCDYFQSFGHDPTAYFGENIIVGGAGCNFSYENDNSINYAVDVMDFRATNSITLKPGFNAKEGSVFTAKILPEYDFICSLFFRESIIDVNSNEADSFYSKLSLKNQSEISVYPNPTSKSFKLKLPHDITILSISIHDNTGRIIFETEGYLEDIDLSSFPNGIYFMEVKTENSVFREKIIKQ